MDWFKNQGKQQSSTSYFTTQNFFIGSPEAESTENSQINLFDVFEDFLGIFPKLAYEKFIITGRKGAGKSAIAESVYMKKSHDLFCDFIKIRDFDSQQLMQAKLDADSVIIHKQLFEWTILVKLINLLLTNQAIIHSKEAHLLKKFIEKNSGKVGLNSFEITEITNSSSVEIEIEQLKRFIANKFKKDVGIKSSKAPFYKVLPTLRETVIALLKEDKPNENNYMLFFDDLDISFNKNDSNKVENLINLIRLSKDYNIDIFGKMGLNVKLIILLRDDIKNTIVNYNADTAKLFSSYEVPLLWYQQNVYLDDEDKLPLKKLINKRIKLNLDNNKIPINSYGPWETLIDYDVNYNSSFKYILDFTFLKPRDIILFFKPLEYNNYRIPLRESDVKKLIKSMTNDIVMELKNELSITYNPTQIEAIFDMLSKVVLKNRFCLEDVDSVVKANTDIFSMSSKELLTSLYDYSIVGNIDNLDRLFFKYRSNPDDPSKVNLAYDFILHKSLMNYFINRY
ncbi:hypothetical protein CDA63_08070 [Hymenobacter amundsenii]|uniref:FunZ protein n=1 Tax=Hymenobacter amundsenii TaxID=2006685 RepID=A0A246FLF6_9BACT|nr:hypothetical protein [Hymenobacter amundsenii]OWP63529.1 hypothetical protein CDA63_08070 [Hymenobacter amundsenii]